jgi:hypothetical protein
MITSPERWVAREIGHADGPVLGPRDARDPRVRRPIIGRGEDERRIANVIRTEATVLDGEVGILLAQCAQLLGDDRCDDANPRPGREERTHFSRRDRPPADDQGGDRATLEQHGIAAHRNPPSAAPDTRRAT